MEKLLLEAVLIYGVKYGIPAAQSIIALWKKDKPTIEEIEALFSTLKKYEDYGIPDKVPTV